MNLHIFRSLGIELMQPDVFVADARRPDPGMRVHRIAMCDNGWILRGHLLSLLERAGFENENATDCPDLIVEWPGGHQNAGVSHLSNVGHVVPLHAFAILF